MIKKREGEDVPKEVLEEYSNPCSCKYAQMIEDIRKQQNFTNLIIIYTDITDLNDAKSRVTFDLDEGNGIYVSNGTYKNITWKKGNATDTLKFFNEDGSELSLNPGRSYIGIVGTGREKLTEIA